MKEEAEAAIAKERALVTLASEAPKPLPSKQVDTADIVQPFVEKTVPARSPSAPQMSASTSSSSSSRQQDQSEKSLKPILRVPSATSTQVSQPLANPSLPPKNGGKGTKPASSLAPTPPLLPARPSTKPPVDHKSLNSKGPSQAPVSKPTPNPSNPSDFSIQPGKAEQKRDERPASYPKARETDAPAMEQYSVKSHEPSVPLSSSATQHATLVVTPPSTYVQASDPPPSQGHSSAQQHTQSHNNAAPPCPEPAEVQPSPLPDTAGPPPYSPPYLPQQASPSVFPTPYPQPQAFMQPPPQLMGRSTHCCLFTPSSLMSFVRLCPIHAPSTDDELPNVPLWPILPP
jgi:hypothetical protein